LGPGAATGGSDVVGADDGAVEVHMRQPGRLHALQRGGKVRCPGRQNGQPLVEVAVGGGDRQAAVAGELGNAGTVDEPAQDEHRLPETAQRTPALAGSGHDAVIAQQSGQVLGGGPLHIEHRGVCDTGRHVRPLGQNNLSQDRSYQGPYTCPDLGTARAAAQALRSQRATGAYRERLTDLDRAKDRYLIRGVLSPGSSTRSTRSPCSGTRSPEPPGSHPQPAPDTPHPKRSTSAHQMNVYAGARKSTFLYPESRVGASPSIISGTVHRRLLMRVVRTGTFAEVD
jgi:hypothetical protein